jgi:hypothetical protein
MKRGLFYTELSNSTRSLNSATIPKINVLGIVAYIIIIVSYFFCNYPQNITIFNEELIAQFD